MKDIGLVPFGAITFIYQCDVCGYWYARYYNQKIICPKCGSKERTHTATINPATILEMHLNDKKYSIRKDLKKL